ncbi:TPA: ankyrin repeat domain-containing protein [Burkholderia vietnamiensis]|nr:ankyrin repeat domain-containing protein [Burkholderia vietnamiensis]
MAFYQEEQLKKFTQSLFQGDLGDVKNYVEKEGFNPNGPIPLLDGAPGQEMSPLVVASNATNGVEVVNYLIEKGADVKAPHNQDALKQAAFWGNNATVNTLLDAGMDIHHNDEQALRACLIDKREDTAQLLLTRGAKADTAIGRILADATDPLKGSIKLKSSSQEGIHWLRDTADKINLKNKLEVETSPKDEFNSIIQGLGKYSAQQQSTKKMKL